MTTTKKDYPQPEGKRFSAYKVEVLLRYQHEQLAALTAAVQRLAKTGGDRMALGRLAGDQDRQADIMRELLTGGPEPAAPESSARLSRVIVDDLNHGDRFDLYFEFDNGWTRSDRLIGGVATPKGIARTLRSMADGIELDIKEGRL